MRSWRKLRVVYWNNIPAPYMVERFNAVAEHTALDFEAWFTARSEPDRSWEVDESTWGFRYRYLSTIRTGRGAVHLPPVALMRRRIDVLVTLYESPVYLLGGLMMRLRGARLVFWVVKSFESWVTRRPLRELVKRIILSHTDGVFTAGADGMSYAGRYGAPPERVHFVPHVIDGAHYARGAALPVAERKDLRKALRVGGVVFLYVGRLWEGKGLRYLLDAFDLTTRRVAGDVSLLLVGDGEHQGALRERCQSRGIGNVVFAGFRQKSELPKYYGLADVFVFPTLGDPYGMVVDEAMAASLPVISTSAAGEIRERIQPGENGYIVAPADPPAMAEAMIRLAHDEALRKRMGRAAAERMGSRSPRDWALTFEDAVRRVAGGGTSTSAGEPQ